MGAAHIGVLKALEEAKIEISCLSGTSIGSVVGAMYAFGMSPEEIEAIATELRWMDISKPVLSKYGLLSNVKLGDLLRRYLGDRRLEDAQIPLTIVATDIAKGHKVVFREGDLAEAVMASSSIPGIYAPIEYKGRLLVDGGVVENVPVETLLTMGPGYTVGVDLNAKHDYRTPKNLVDVMMHSFHHMMRAAIDPQIVHADLMIEPDLAGYSRADTSKVGEMVQRGYVAAVEAIERSERQAVSDFVRP